MRDASLQQRGDGEGQPGQEGLEAFPAIPSKCVPEGRRAACASGMFSCSELSPILLFSAAAEGKRPRLTLMCLSGRSKTGERSGRPLSLPNSELADQVHFFASAVLTVLRASNVEKVGRRPKTITRVSPARIE